MPECLFTYLVSPSLFSNQKLYVYFRKKSMQFKIHDPYHRAGRSMIPESGVHKKTNDYTKLHEEVKDGIRKLQDAECMIKHLFSDQQWNLSVHKSLFLPNIPQKIIRCLLRMHNTQGTTDVENTVNLLLPKCSKNNPEELFYPPAGLQNSCLCADQLKSSTATHYLKLWLGSTFTETDVSPVITDEQYRTVIYR